YPRRRLLLGAHVTRAHAERNRADRFCALVGRLRYDRPPHPRPRRRVLPALGLRARGSLRPIPRTGRLPAQTTPLRWDSGLGVPGRAAARTGSAALRTT